MAKSELLPQVDIEDVAPTKGETSPVYGGISQKKLDTYYGSIENLKQKIQKLQGDISADWKAFEEHGGNKKALKWAMQVAGMEAGAARDFLRAFIEYLEGLGIDEDKQLDLFGNNPASLLQKKEVTQPTEANLKSVN